MFPDNLTDPFPKTDAEENKAPTAASSSVAQPPLPPPLASKHSDEMSVDNSGKEKATHTANIK